MAVLFAALATGFASMTLNKTKKDFMYWPINEVISWLNATQEAGKIHDATAQALACLPSPDMFLTTLSDDQSPPFAPWAKDTSVRPANAQEMINAYDNSIHAIDRSIQSIFEDRQKKDFYKRPILYVFIGAYGEYLGQNGIWSMSDAGADTLDYHANPASRVGMFVLATPAFEALHPDFAKALANLRKNANKKVGHVHLFHTLLGLLNIQSPHRDPQLDLTTAKLKNKNAFNRFCRPGKCRRARMCRARRTGRGTVAAIFWLVIG